MVGDKLASSFAAFIHRRMCFEREHTAGPEMRRAALCKSARTHWPAATTQNAEASSTKGSRTPALGARTATKACNSAELITFLNETDVNGLTRRTAAKHQEEQETARIANLVLAFAGFLGQNWSLEPQPCLQILRLIETRLNEAELSRDLPQPLPAGADARRFLVRIPAQPHTEDFEQVVYRAVVGLLYLAENPEMRRQILRGLAELFRLEIQRAERGV